MRKGSKKICKSFKIYLNSNDYQFKTSRYSYQSTYMNPMITTNQKPTRDQQKLARKEHKHTIKKNHPDVLAGAPIAILDYKVTLEKELPHSEAMR